MARPATLLQELCAHALSLGAKTLAVVYKDRHQSVYVRINGTDIRIANYITSGADATELRQNLAAAAKKPVRTVIVGQVYILKVRPLENFGEDALGISIDTAPKPDPPVAPAFTAKQGQYRAFIHNYTKIHRSGPAELDLQHYFRVSPPSIHNMIKTLERNSLIAKTPGRADPFAFS